ncbi:hypothetical protein L388_05507, partial [Klebsiella oxytoca MGH 42]
MVTLGTLRLPVVAGSSPALRVMASMSIALRGAAGVSVLPDSKRCLNYGACSCRSGSAAFTGRRWRPLRKAGEPASPGISFLCIQR